MTRPSVVRLSCRALEPRDLPANLLVAAADAGGGPHVKLYETQEATSILRHEFYAYDPAFRGGVRVAMGDFTGDGVDDIVTAPGRGGGPHIKIFDGVTGAVVRQWLAYDSSFTGGVFVAAGDVTGDAIPDVVTGADAGGGPHVKVFDGATGAEVRSFFAYDARFTSGVRVAVGDVNGDFVGDIVTGAGPGGGPHVRVFDGLTLTPIRSLLAGPASATGGVSLAVGDANDDQVDDVVVTVAGSQFGVRVYDGTNGNLLSTSPTESDSLRLGYANGELLKIAGPNGVARAVHGPLGIGIPGGSFDVFDVAFRGGAFIAGGRDVRDRILTQSFDFAQGAQGWQAVNGIGATGIQALPSEIGAGNGYELDVASGSIGLLKRAFDVAPNLRYRLVVSVELATKINNPFYTDQIPMLPISDFTISLDPPFTPLPGTAVPGTSVSPAAPILIGGLLGATPGTVYASASPVEPLAQSGLPGSVNVNFSPASPTRTGTAIGKTFATGIPYGVSYQQQTLTGSPDRPPLSTAVDSTHGKLWVSVGHQEIVPSGETVYYRRITVQLIPLGRA